MTTTDNSPLHVHGPADLLIAVPYLLGFHPQESLVLIGLADTRVAVTARIDLSGLADAPVVADTLGAIKRGDATAIVAAVFTEKVAPGAPIAVSLDEAAQRAGLQLMDTLLVTRGRWRSLGCANSRCCPPQGTPMPTAPTALDAAATYAGLTALPNRDALTAMFNPLPERPDLTAPLEHHHHEQLDAVLHNRQHTSARSMIRALFAAQRAAQGDRMPTDDDAARYGVALQTYTVRDAVWLAVDDGRLDGIELWVNLARRLPSPYDAPPLFLAAWRAWRDGDGALAGIAADLALRSDPGYSAADLLLAALARGIDPATLPKLRMPAAAKAGDEPTDA